MDHKIEHTLAEKGVFLFVSTAIILVASGAVYAFAPLQLMLVTSGVYSELCMNHPTTRTVSSLGEAQLEEANTHMVSTERNPHCC